MKKKQGPPRERIRLSPGGPRYRESGDNARCREWLRRDFEGRCAYCLWHVERSRDVDFEIDHFHPRSRGGKDHYYNLRYSCGACNRRKGNLPTNKQRARGERILDPCAEWDYGHHLSEGADHLLEANTVEGRFHLKRLHLNGSKLVTERRKRDEKIARYEELAREADQLDDSHEDLQIKLRAYLLEERRDLALMLPRLSTWSAMVRTSSPT